MNYFKIYSLLPIQVQNWIVGLYSEKLKLERGGKVFEEILDFLQTTKDWTAAQILAYKEEHVFRILEQAYFHCPFYKKKYDAVGVKPSDFTCLADLQKFPILTKEELRENFAGMTADNVRAKDRIKYHTSGTSGTALDFYNSKYNLRFYWAVCARYNLRFGINPGTRSLNFTGKMVTPINQNKPPYWRYKRAQNQFMIPMVHITKEKVPSIVDFINGDGFETIVGYPSITSSFASFVNDLGLRISNVPKYYFSGAEKVYDSQKEEIEKAFPGIQVVEHYGFSENAGAASKCVFGEYHEDFELGHFELENAAKDGDFETGVLLTTGFHNYAMPFIRYEVGDTVTFDNRPCKCGLHSQVIHEINGRNEDYVLTPEGTRIMRFDYLFKDTHEIREAQVVQRELGEIVLRIVQRPEYRQQAMEEFLEKKVHTLISPSLKVYFEYVDEIERTKAGKFKAVVSEIRA